MALKKYYVYGNEISATDSHGYNRSWKSYIAYTKVETTNDVTINILECGIKATHQGTTSFAKKYLTQKLTFDGKDIRTYENSKKIEIKYKSNPSDALKALITKDFNHTVSRGSSRKTFTITTTATAVKGAWKGTSSVTLSVPIEPMSLPNADVSFEKIVEDGVRKIKATLKIYNIKSAGHADVKLSVGIPSYVTKKYPSISTTNTGSYTKWTDFSGAVPTLTASKVITLKDGSINKTFSRLIPWEVTADVRLVSGSSERTLSDSHKFAVSAKYVETTIRHRITETMPIPTRRSDGTADIELYIRYGNEWKRISENGVKMTHYREYDATTKQEVLKGYELHPQVPVKYLPDPLATGIFHTDESSTDRWFKWSYVIETMEDKASNVAFYNTSRTVNYTNGLANCVFVGGCASPDYRSRVWYSYVNNPLYFPDTNYIEVGSNDTKVMGLTKIGEYLGIIKQGKTTDSSIYIAYPTSFDNDTTYAVRPSVNGIGSCSEFAFNILGDETLFLSEDGVMAISFGEEDIDKQVRNRSYYVDGRLLKEKNLQKAYSFVYKGFYMLAVPTDDTDEEADNGHIYILDGNQQNSWGNDKTNLVYECYFWKNVPAKCFARYRDALWFSDGKNLCRFKDADDDAPYNDDGAPIKAEWSTILDDDGSTYYFKNLQKKGTMVSISPAGETSAEIYVKRDNEPETLVTSYDSEARDIPSDIYLKKKIKKYKRIQFIVRNDVNDEPFGIDQIVKLYTFGNYSKNRG